MITSDKTPSCSMHRSGFTLVEMLTVIVIIGFLLGASALSVRKARGIARKTKAETEMRELVNAFLEYYVVYHEDAQAIAKLPKGEVEVTRPVVELVSNGDKNPKGLVFLNYTLPEGVSTYNDPWGHPYRLYFNDGSEKPKHFVELETCVSFPYRRGNPLYRLADDE